MPVKAIKVDKVFENTSKAGKPWWKIVEPDGTFYSVWDVPVAGQLPVGTEATVDFYEKNGFNTISKLVMVSKAPYTSNVSHEPIKPPAARVEVPEVATIVAERMAAYGAAALLVSHGKIDYKDIDKAADSALNYYQKASHKVKPLPDTTEINQDYIDNFIRED